MGFWLLLILGMIAAGIGIDWLYLGKYDASTAALVLAVLCVLLAIAVKIASKGKRKEGKE